MQRIAVLGANGVYARHLLPRLAGAGFDVVALVRRPDAAGVARGCGVAVKVADIFDEASRALPWPRSAAGRASSLSSSALGAPEGFPSFRLKNTRAKQALDCQPFYATYQQSQLPHDTHPSMSRPSATRPV